MKKLLTFLAILVGIAGIFYIFKSDEGLKFAQRLLGDLPLFDVLSSFGDAEKLMNTDPMYYLNETIKLIGQDSFFIVFSGLTTALSQKLVFPLFYKGDITEEIMDGIWYHMADFIVKILAVIIGLSLGNYLKDLVLKLNISLFPKEFIGELPIQTGLLTFLLICFVIQILYYLFIGMMRKSYDSMILWHICAIPFSAWLMCIINMLILWAFLFASIHQWIGCIICMSGFLFFIYKKDSMVLSCAKGTAIVLKTFFIYFFQ